jgi:hypothetical protein
MERPPPATRVVPGTALVHFAVTQRQYAALLASIKYFASKLRDPKEREVAESAWRAISSITHFSLPSEGGEDAGPEPVVPAAGSTTTDQPQPPTAPRGLAALGRRAP